MAGLESSKPQSKDLAAEESPLQDGPKPAKTVNDDLKSKQMKEVLDSFLGSKEGEIHQSRSSIQDRPDADSFFMSGLFEINEAYEAIGNKKAQWDQYTKEIENAIPQARKEYEQARQRAFPEAVAHLEAAKKALQQGDISKHFSPYISPPSPRLISTIGPQVSESAPSFNFPSQWQTALSTEIEKLDRPPLSERIAHQEESLLLSIKSCLSVDQFNEARSLIVHSGQTSRPINHYAALRSINQKLDANPQYPASAGELIDDLEREFSVNGARIPCENKGASNRFSELVKKDADRRIPKYIQHFLADRGYGIVTPENGVKDELPWLVRTLNIGPEGRGYDTAQGMQIDNEIVVPEKTPDTEPIPKDYWLNFTELPSEYAHTLAHEIGHAIDREFKWFSDSEAFKLAYEHDLARAKKLAEQTGKNHTYLFRTGKNTDNDRREFVAECVAAMVGKDSYVIDAELMKHIDLVCPEMKALVLGKLSEIK